jgi:15-cis-phytoene synthase
MTAQADATGVSAAYRHCEQVTRAQARNFSYGIRLLPPGKRRALSAVYAFARRVDDIGDGTMPVADKLAALAKARADVAALGDRLLDTTVVGDTGPGGTGPDQMRPAAAGAGEAPAAAGGDQVLVALADAARRYPIPLSAFGELIDGCEADVRGTSYATHRELEHYCRCVAGSIGRLSLGVFGSRDPQAAERLADSLGIALQLTNILRDVREDLGNARVYLPAEDLERFGATLRPERADALAGDPALTELIRFEARRALDWYATGLQLLPLLDRRSAASAGAMAGIYLRLLRQIAAAPQAALQQRQSLAGRAKLAVAVRALAGIGERVPVAGAAHPSSRGAGRPASADGPLADSPLADSPVSNSTAGGEP